jgi:VIT1/CCC1 family predicted Fe2+/Mn2+ transporter
VQTPLPAKCSRHTREGEVCCQELKGEDERQLIDPDVVRDVVIGLSDGLTVPFALTAGLSSLGESKLVVLGGIAELIAGAISMGIGGFLASQAERDHYRFLRRTTKARVRRSCDGEMEREVHAVLGAVGVDEKVSRQLAHSLLEVESAIERNDNDLQDEERGLRWSQSVGITEFLLKFGEGLEEVPTRRLYVSAFTIGMGYLLGGVIPLLPYFFIPKAHIALMYSSIFTGIVLLVFGAVKARITGAAGKGAGGYVWGAVSTLAVGGAAAAAAYGIVALLEGSE